MPVYPGALELLGFSVAVIQPPLAALTGGLIHKSNLLKAGVIIYAYNHHARLLPSEPLVVKQPKSTRVEGADTVMQSSASDGSRVVLHFVGGEAWRIRCSSRFCVFECI